MPERGWRKGSPPTRLGGVYQQAAAATRKVPQKRKLELSHDPAVPLLGGYPDRLIQNDTQPRAQAAPPRRAGSTAPAGGRWRPSDVPRRAGARSSAAHAHWSTTAARRTAPPRGHAGHRANRRETPPLPLTRGTRNRTPANLGSRDSRTEGTEASLRPPRGGGRGRDWEVRVSRGKPVPKGRATRPDCAYTGRPFNAPGRTAPERAGKRRQRAAESPAPQKSEHHGESTIRQRKKRQLSHLTLRYDDRSRSKSVCRQACPSTAISRGRHGFHRRTRSASLPKCLSDFSMRAMLASLVAQKVKNLPAMQETRIQFLGQEDPLEKTIATTPVSSPRESRGQRSLKGNSPRGRRELTTTEPLTLTSLSVLASWNGLSTVFPSGLQIRDGHVHRARFTADSRQDLQQNTGGLLSAARQPGQGHLKGCMNTLRPSAAHLKSSQHC